jgi:ArsR family transcriptional regulator
MEIHKLADCFKALGDPTRLKMIALLNLRDFCVCEFIPIFNISQPAISKHLSRLKSVELVTENRKGQWVFYSLHRERLESIGLALKNLPDVSEELRKLEEKGVLVNCE